MRHPGEITRREMWFATAVYRWTQFTGALRRLRYRLGGRCYACPGNYGRHKFTCPVGRKEMLR